MILYHATPTVNVPSVLSRGLRAELDKRGKGRVWMVSHGRVPWAILHVAAAHGVKAEDVSVVRITGRRYRAIRGPVRGLWYWPADVLPAYLADVTEALRAEYGAGACGQIWQKSSGEVSALSTGKG